MARTAQQQLDALDAMIALIESGDGVAEWGEAAQRMKLHDLPRLYGERRKLEERVAREISRGGIYLAQPVCE